MNLKKLIENFYTNVEICEYPLVIAYMLISLLIVFFLVICIWLWRTRDRNLQNLSLQQEWLRSFYHLALLLSLSVPYIISSICNYYFEQQDDYLNQTIVRETVFHQAIVRFEFYSTHIVFLGAGFSAFLYAKTRLPYFATALNLPYVVTVTIPFVSLISLFFIDGELINWFCVPWFMGVTGLLVQVWVSFVSLIRRA